jgi:Uma2 family endonuclease
MNALLAPRGMSAAEYFVWSETQLERYDFYNGEVFAMSGGTDSHNTITGNVFSALKSHLTGTPCRVFINDVRLEVARNSHYTYPDVFVTCDERDRGADAKLTKRHPNLVCEVLSPSTAAYDLGDKFEHYQQSESLIEILFIDPERRTPRLYRRNAVARWEIVPVDPLVGVLLESVNMTISFATLYENVELAQ